MPNNSIMMNSNSYARALPSLTIFPYLAANRQVEITNRTILRNLKTRLEKSKSKWVKDLSSILWAYHTTSRIPTGETSFSMVYEMKLVIPVKIGMPSFKILNFDKKNNKIELR